jgi:L-threonylcarbamoyladenylate synthase
VILPPSEDVFCEAAKLLRQGGLLAFPTETYYGLGVDPWNTRALQRLFAVKQRASKKPVLLLVADQTQVQLVAAQVPRPLQQLMTQFWPGPLTLVCPARPELPHLLTGGTGSIGVRQSPEATANRLIAAFAGPITATSANRSGQPAAVTAAEVAAVFGKQLDLIIDGGQTPGGLGSTLVACDSQEQLCCLREGRISWEAIRKRMA